VTAFLQSKAGIVFIIVAGLVIMCCLGGTFILISTALTGGAR
jgi:hypothetical protein